MRFQIICILAIAMLCVSCSGGGASSPATPSLTSDRQQGHSALSTSRTHYNWGLWEFTADPDAGTLDFIKLRSGRMHVNVLPFLEPPAGVKLSISNLVFDELICDVDVSLTHPFPGMSRYIGFDVTGIMMSIGTNDSWQYSDIMMAAGGDTRILNPDGFTRWWNPEEFSIPGPPIMRYRDGLLGNPNSSTGFNCTINGYKLFGDDLDTDNEILDLDPSNRIPFSDGYTNTRHYTIDFNGGLKFNYAVDANWEPIEGTPPFEPEDFPENANRPEAWAVSITEVENTLWYDSGDSGGDLSLLIDVYDHYNADQNFLWLDSPGNFDFATTSTVVGGGEGFSTYQMDITGAYPASLDPIDILIGAESEVIGYCDVIEDYPITAYFMYTAEIGTLSPESPTAIMEATTDTSIIVGGTVSFDASASTGTAPLAFEWDFNGDDVYDGPEDAYVGDVETPTHQFDDYGVYNVTVKVTNDYGEDISDAVVVQVGFDPDDTYVDADYTGGDSDGTMEKPFLTIQDGVADVDAGKVVHVDYYDGSDNTYDTNGLTLKSNFTLRGDNWNGGGPGKPKMDNDVGSYTIGASYSSLSDFTLEGFEIGIGGLSDTSNHGVYIYGGTNSNITVRHCNVTDYVDDTGKTGGPGSAMWFAACNNLLCEFNDIGPITWESETPGVYARVLWGLHFNECGNSEVKNNFIHDVTIDYDGDGLSWGQIRVFNLHCYRCNDIDVHNNLICHIEGVNDYDYRIEGMMMEGYSGPQEFHYYNNTIDALDHSQSNGGFPLRGIFIYANSAPGTYINNTLITNFDGPGSYSSIQTYFSSPANVYEITYSTAYNQDAATDYFHNLIEGDGITNYPGLDPMYVDAVNEPYDYHFQSGSECEFGDPNFLDWDDTGAASGDPYEADINNRSRMGCFGGPDGDWDPNNL